MIMMMTDRIDGRTRADISPFGYVALCAAMIVLAWVMAG